MKRRVVLVNTNEVVRLNKGNKENEVICSCGNEVIIKDTNRNIKIVKTCSKCLSSYLPFNSSYNNNSVDLNMQIDRNYIEQIVSNIDKCFKRKPI
ncbi:hypothetical protein [Senegalia massiliensis]|uniref:Uncharacterized protein n=1 Tax=Senegalia massiliensis TaxID=1720316 RepID=A0A845QZG5_9CLOT|nr:hypothetical protein [Senegalia massiliensis]NBI07560.1 hypothetical protein [Senegalia massiliensis]